MTNYVVPPRTDDPGEIARWRQSVADAINTIKTSLWGTDGSGDATGDGGLYSASAVTTQAVTDILSTTATGNGTVTALGTPNATQHGVCWNTTGTPTVYNKNTEEGAPSATGAFTSSMTGLTPETLYYVRAYITNALGTTYNDEVSFTTDAEALEISSTKMVYYFGVFFDITEYIEENEGYYWNGAFDGADECVYLGADVPWTKFSFLKLVSGAFAVGTGAIVLNYFDGTNFDKTVSVDTDGTKVGDDCFAKNGSVTFAAPEDWETGANIIDAELSSNLYWIKVSTTNIASQAPAIEYLSPENEV